MMLVVHIGVAAAAMAIVATLGMRAVARRMEVVDGPDGFRKTQREGIPLLGGAAVFLAFWGSLAVGRLIAHGVGEASRLDGECLLVLLAASFLVLSLGLVDDLRGLGAAPRLVGMCAASMAMFAAGCRIGAVSSPFGGTIQLGWLALPVTIFWFMGCMNALNLIDGLDGLAAGVALFVSSTVLLVGAMFGNGGASVLAAALAGSCLGFLIFNFHPASIYLGDGGSLLLGFLLAFIGLKGAQKSHMVVALLIPVIALGLPIADTSLAILRRWARSLPLRCSDREHIHHKLLDMGMSHRKAVLLLYGGCIILGLLALLTAAAKSAQAALALALLGTLVFAAIRVFGHKECHLLKAKVIGYIREREERARCRIAGHVASQNMGSAGSLDEIWNSFVGAAETMELDAIELALSARPDGELQGESHYRWHNGASEGDGKDDVVWTAAVRLQTRSGPVGHLHLSKRTNGRPLSGDIPVMLQVLSESLATNAERVGISRTPKSGAQRDSKRDGSVLRAFRERPVG
jgi:UDP-GlcNAc:undecaprenyl-phosphate GlcNAc-1-phosphate transferase